MLVILIKLFEKLNRKIKTNVRNKYQLIDNIELAESNGVSADLLRVLNRWIQFTLIVKSNNAVLLKMIITIW